MVFSRSKDRDLQTLFVEFGGQPYRVCFQLPA